jgi:hypothetical protein
MTHEEKAGIFKTLEEIASDPSGLGEALYSRVVDWLRDQIDWLPSYDINEFDYESPKLGECDRQVAEKIRWVAARGLHAANEKAIGEFANFEPDGLHVPR